LNVNVAETTMSAFSDLPLVIEPADLADRLDAPELIN